MAIPRFGFIVIGVLFLAVSQLSGQDGTTARETLVVRVNFYNYVGVPPGDLDVATATVAQIFRQTGIEVVWFDVPVSGQAETALRQTGRQLGAVDLRVRVVPEPMVPVWAKKTHQVAFSLLPKDGAFGTVAGIYSERLQRIARRESRPEGLVLGCVIAHEMGHLLLRMKGHSRSGPMSFPVTGQFLTLASRGRLGFTKAQARQIRRELQERYKFDGRLSRSTTGLTRLSVRPEAMVDPDR